MMRQISRYWLGRMVLLCGSLAVGCAPAGGGGGGGGGGSGGVPPPTGGTMGELDEDAPLPPTEAELSEIMAEVIGQCNAVIGQVEADSLPHCDTSSGIPELLQIFADAHADAVDAGALPGRNATAVVPARAAEADLSGDVVNVLGCTTYPDPSCANGGRCPAPINALALTNTTYILEPLMAAFVEGAAWWGVLAAEAGGDPEAVDAEQFITGLGEIFYNAAQAEPFQVVTQADAVAMLDEDPFTYETWFGSTAFVVFHELGHANMAHSVVNHAARVGVERVLSDMGVELTDEQSAELDRELLQLKVGVETQADIYAATLLGRLGIASYGPRLLTAGIFSLNVRLGVCAEETDTELQFACLLQDTPEADHPPLNVRATLVRRIIDEGEDLTHLLDAGEAYQLGDQ